MATPNPSFISAGALASGTGAITVTWPGTYADGDLAVLVVNTASEYPTLPEWPRADGTATDDGAGGGAGDTGVYVTWKIISGGTQSSISIPDSGSYTTGQLFIFRDVPLDWDWDIFPTVGLWPYTNWYYTSTDESATSTITCPGSDVDEVPAGSTVVNIIGLDKDAADTDTITGTYVNATLSSITERADATVTSGAGGGIALITGVVASTGTVDATTNTADSSTRHAYFTLIIEPRNTALENSIDPLGDRTFCVVSANLGGGGTFVSPLEPQPLSAQANTVLVVGHPYEPYLVGYGPLAYFADGDSGTSLTLNWPLGYADGDLAILFITRPYGVTIADVWSSYTSNNQTGSSAGYHAEVKYITGGAQSPIVATVGNSAATGCLCVVRQGTVDLNSPPSWYADAETSQTRIRWYYPSAHYAGSLEVGFSHAKRSAGYTAPMLSGNITNTYISNPVVGFDTARPGSNYGFGMVAFTGRWNSDISTDYTTAATASTLDVQYSLLISVRYRPDLLGRITSTSAATATLTVAAGLLATAASTADSWGVLQPWVSFWTRSESTATGVLGNFYWQGGAVAESTATPPYLRDSVILLSTVYSASESADVYYTAYTLDSSDYYGDVSAASYGNTTLMVGHVRSSYPDQTSNDSKAVAIKFHGDSTGYGITTVAANWHGASLCNGVLYATVTPHRYTIGSGFTNPQISVLPGYKVNNPDMLAFQAGNLCSLVMPFAAQWTDIAHANGLYMAIPWYIDDVAATVYYTSPDGVTWTSRTLPAAGMKYCCAYKGVFHMSDGSTATYKSSNGTSWTADTFEIGSSCHVIEGDVLSAGSNSSQYSTDGVSWSYAPGEGFCYGTSNGVPVYLSSDYDSSHFWVRYSFDLSSWDYVIATGINFGLGGGQFLLSNGDNLLCAPEHVWYDYLQSKTSFSVRKASSLSTTAVSNVYLMTPLSGTLSCESAAQIRGADCVADTWRQPQFHAYGEVSLGGAVTTVFNTNGITVFDGSYPGSLPSPRPATLDPPLPYALSMTGADIRRTTDGATWTTVYTAGGTMWTTAVLRGSEVIVQLDNSYSAVYSSNNGSSFSSGVTLPVKSTTFIHEYSDGTILYGGRMASNNPGDTEWLLYRPTSSASLTYIGVSIDAAWESDTHYFASAGRQAFWAEKANPAAYLWYKSLTYDGVTLATMPGAVVYEIDGMLLMFSSSNPAPAVPVYYSINGLDFYTSPTAGTGFGGEYYPPLNARGGFTAANGRRGALTSGGTSYYEYEVGTFSKARGRLTSFVFYWGAAVVVELVATADLTTNPSMRTNAAARAYCDAYLTVPPPPWRADPIAVATCTADLSGGAVAHLLEAAPAALAYATANLLIGADLQFSATTLYALATTRGTLKTLLTTPLVADAECYFSATGELFPAWLAGIISGLPAASGTLTTQIRLVASVSSDSTAIAALTRRTTFSSAVSAVSTGEGNFGVSITMRGAPQGIVTCGGVLLTQILLEAEAEAVSSCTGRFFKVEDDQVRAATKIAPVWTRGTVNKAFVRKHLL